LASVPCGELPGVRLADRDFFKLSAPRTIALYPFFSIVRSRTTMFGSTLITLTGIRNPSSLNS